MEEENMTTKRALLVLGFLFVLILISVVIPSTWLGVDQKKPALERINISSSSFLKGKVADTNQDNSISWKELVTSTLDPDEIEVLKNKQPDPKIIAQLNDPNNLTASFSKNLYLTSTALAGKKTSTAEGEQQILNDLMAQEAAKIKPTTYSYKDINVSQNETSTSIKEYGNTVAKLFLDAVTEKSVTEDLEGILSFIEKGDKTSLDAVVRDYKKMDTVLEKLRTIPVPLSAVTYHIYVMNKAALYRDSLYNLSMASDDPVRATIFLDRHPNITLSFLRSYEDLSTYFNIKNILFTSKDPGYVFIVGYTFK